MIEHDANLLVLIAEILLDETLTYSEKYERIDKIIRESK